VLSISRRRQGYRVIGILDLVVRDRRIGRVGRERSWSEGCWIEKASDPTVPYGDRASPSDARRQARGRAVRVLPAAVQAPEPG